MRLRERRERIREDLTDDQQDMARLRDGRYGATKRLCESWKEVNAE